MARSTLALAAASLALAACGSTPEPAPAPGPSAAQPPAPFRVERAEVRALRDYVYADYDLRLLRDAGQHPDGLERAVLEERRALARAALEQALREGGADPARLERPDGLLPTFLEGMQESGRYELVMGPGEDSFAVVRVQARGEERRLSLFGEPFSYRRTIYDERLVEDYPTWASRRLALPHVPRAATYTAEGTVALDLAVARRLGEQAFLPRVEALRAAGAADPTRYGALAQPERLADLLALTKDALRWRSLQPLWSMVQSRPRDEQLMRFAEDYVERAELRMAAEMRELARLQAAAGGAPDASQQVRLFELASLSAIVHGEPLGQTADVVALAAASLQAEAPLPGPHFRAARQLVIDLVSRLREGPPSAEADAAAFARLAQASPEALRALASAAYAERTS